MMENNKEEFKPTITWEQLNKMIIEQEEEEDTIC